MAALNDANNSGGFGPTLAIGAAAGVAVGLAANRIGWQLGCRPRRGACRGAQDL
jgi:hypothetical protein